MQKSYLIFGVSKGLGKAITQSIPTREDIVFGISRSEPAYLNTFKHVKWIPADLSSPHDAVTKVKQRIGAQKLDCLIYNVGIWEDNAFSEAYNFQENTPAALEQLIQTNVTSCLLMVQAFIPNLKLADNAKIILIGSTWGLENHNGKEVAFSATKFAIRGIAHALRENLRDFKVGVSVLNLGYLATEYTLDEPTEDVIKKTEAGLIPLQDVIHALRFVLSVSAASCVKEIIMPAMQDKNV